MNLPHHLHGRQSRVGPKTDCVQPATHPLITTAFAENGWPIPYQAISATPFRAPKRVSIHAAATDLCLAESLRSINAHIPKDYAEPYRIEQSFTRVAKHQRSLVRQLHQQRRVELLRKYNGPVLIALAIGAAVYFVARSIGGAL